MRRFVSIVTLALGCNASPREPKKSAAFMPSTTEPAKQLCAHLADLGCEQRTECAKERDFHLATRDMRVECLMAATTQAEVLACGTVTCQPLPKRKP